MTYDRTEAEKILGRIHQYTQDKNIPFFIFYIRDPDISHGRFLEIEAFSVEQGIPLRKIPLIENVFCILVRLMRFII